MILAIKRIYDAPLKTDGYRILVDRLWPRGISKEYARLYKWEKEITPTTEIRQEFGHKANKFDWFKGAYINELDKNPYTKIFIGEIKNLLTRGNVTLLYGAKDPQINHAIILKDYIEKKL